MNMTTYKNDEEKIFTHQNKRARKSARTVRYTLKVTEVGETYSSADIIKRMEYVKTPDTRLGRVPTNWIPSSACSLAHKLRQFPQYWRMKQVSPDNKSVFEWERIA